MRVRAFVQDDAHIFCTEAQILPETAAFIDLLQQIYADFGFTEILVKLSTRPDKRIGSDEVWDKAEAALAEALAAKGLIYDLQPGEGAFYGPKIEFSLKDCLGRVWQCGTLQLDFALPQRLDAHYVGEDNERHIPVMLHRAILGSLERFIGILVEHYAGAMPLWLSPIQAVVLNISGKQSEYAEQVAARLREAGLRVEADLRNEKITYKIREHSLSKLPYQIVVGDKEVAANLVAVRTRGGRDLGQMSVEALTGRLLDEIAARSGTA
jgi:threonyl-tRNA synthetase